MSEARKFLRIRRILILAAFLIVIAFLVTAISIQIIGQMPSLVLNLGDTSASTPSEIQADCRSNYAKFAEIIKDYPDSSFVWCGGNELYIVKNTGLRLENKIDENGFISVRFISQKLKSISGYIIDPTGVPSELGRINIDNADELDYESVSMSVRAVLRSGEIKFDNAAYLWAEGSNEVIAVRMDSYVPLGENVVVYTDDGNRPQVFRILDTELEMEK